MNDIPAIAGSVDATVLSDLVILRDFMNRRDQALRRLFNRQLGRSQLRDEVLRSALIEFAQSRLQPISFYQRTCAVVASPTATRDEIRLMASYGVILLREATDKRKGVLVVPTQRLVDWYNDRMPRLEDEARALVAARA